MKYWVKYRRGSSASAGNWEWKMLYSDTLEGAEEEAQELANEIHAEYQWSEHHRSVEWHVLTKAPKHVVEARLTGTKASIERMQRAVIRLEEEAAVAKECECVGEQEYSCYCKHCGRTLRKVKA